MHYKSHYQTVLGSKIHYIDEGEGHPIIFLHGMPTWSYLWRNIIPHLVGSARCIAPDLIGMGKSDKPDISYTVFDHIKYIEAFINALNLTQFTLVMHGWGSVIGFHYASQHESAIRGLAFYESIVKPITEWKMLSLPLQQLAVLLQDTEKSHKAIIEDNFFIETLLPRGCLTKLPSDVMENYRMPFPTPKSRELLWQFVLDRPLGKEKSKVGDLIASYSKWLQNTPIPKLLMYTVPGFITTMSGVSWCKENLSHLTLADLGEGLHFIQETNPDIFGQTLANWHKKIEK